MKRMACVAMVAMLVVAGAVWGAEAERRKGDPSAENMAKMRAAAPTKARVQPARPRKMLVLSYQSHTQGRYAGEKALELMGARTGAYELEFVRTAKGLVETVVPENLKKYDAVCVNNSTGGGGKAANGKTFVENIHDYVAAGGGLVGIHSATDNRLGEVFGGFFCGHPWHEDVGVKIDDPDHPLCKVFAKKGFMVRDEIYQFARIYSREKLRVLLSLDMAKTRDKGKRKDKDNAVAWVKALGKGRIFYCSLGHDPHIFWDAKLLRFYLDGIQYALGDLKGIDATPSAKLAQQPTPALVPDK